MGEKIKKDFSKNRIIFGAPGTGKSYKLQVESKELFGDKGERVSRVTFHPNYSYAQFVGTYKPVPVSTDSFTEEEINSEIPEILSILKDKTMPAQDKYNILRQKKYFRDDRLMVLNLLVGLATGEIVQTLKVGSDKLEDDSSQSVKKGIQLRTFAELRDISKSSDISYKYVPGPFMRVYVDAKKDPDNKYLLLIEEINRANVAAVFGDVFQLLDRDDSGDSQYPIDMSEDQKNYLKSRGIFEDKMSIPKNMYIWATMNSADQGVYPMDAAFKRRWDFEYLGIDDAASEIENIMIPISRDGKKTVKWNDFRIQLNEKLDSIGVNEDKLLGPYFLSKNTLDKAKYSADQFVSLFESKVIMYLLEDVVKMQPSKLFQTDKPTRRYSKICEEFEEKGMKVFALVDVEVFEGSN